MGMPSAALGQDSAQPAVCRNCGRPIMLPERSTALLNEYGFALVVCECGVANRLPFEHVDPEPPSRPRRRSWVAVALWLVIIGLLVLMLPSIRIEKTQDPQPPDYLTV